MNSSKENSRLKLIPAPAPRPRPSSSPFNNFGFSLVELMVAGVIMGIAVIGVMTMLSVGRALETDDRLRRQALSLISSELEKNMYQQFDATIINPSRTDITNTNIHTDALVPVPAVLTVTIENAFTRWTDGDNPIVQIIVPYQDVTATLAWTFAGKTDSIILQKSIAAEY